MMCELTVTNVKTRRAFAQKFVEFRRKCASVRAMRVLGKLPSSHARTHKLPPRRKSNDGASSFQSSSTMAAPTRFTDALRLAAGEQWDRVITHKFTKELATGTIDRAVLKKYLIQDYRFLDAFVILLSSMVAHARTLEDRIPGCQFLAIITGKENTYFERSFERLECSAQERDDTPYAACATGFINLMKTVAKEGSLG